MKRGDVVRVAVTGDCGKPRPAVVIQSDLFDEHPSLTVLPITSDLRDAPAFRVDLPSDAWTGLRLPSQAMVDKIHTVRREKVGGVIGTIDESRMLSINRALAVFLGIA